MEIKELRLHAKDLDALEQFYQGILGFNCDHSNKDELILSTRENKLIFQQSDSGFYYHFAFLIPSDSLESAIEYCESRDIELLTLEGSKVIHFPTGRSIYFYDPEGNIAEFIERPRLDYPPNTEFSIDQVIKLNEIGLPVTNPMEVASRLVDECGIQPIDRNSFSENFCWVGDENGVIIVVKEGRPWLPTDKPGIVNDFTVEYRDAGEQGRITFNEGAIGRG